MTPVLIKLDPLFLKKNLGEQHYSSRRHLLGQLSIYQSLHKRALKHMQKVKDSEERERDGSSKEGSGVGVNFVHVKSISTVIFISNI